MKVSELVDKLATLQEIHGDTTVQVYVDDLSAMRDVADIACIRNIADAYRCVSVTENAGYVVIIGVGI